MLPSRTKWLLLLSVICRLDSSAVRTVLDILIKLSNNMLKCVLQLFLLSLQLVASMTRILHSSYGMKSIARWLCKGHSYFFTINNLHFLQYGICFDIDGVVARGLSPIPEAVEAFKMLCDEKTGRPKVPFVFLTNGFNSAHVKAQRLQNWLQCEVIYMPLASNVSRCYWFVCHQKYYLC